MKSLRSALSLPIFFRPSQRCTLAEQPAPSAELAQALATFRHLIDNYLSADDRRVVLKAFDFAQQAHSGQFRASGEAFFFHPLAVATTLATWQLDAKTITAALLHDVVEDTPITKNEITRVFGKETAELVDGVSKLDRIENQSWEEAQAENIRKMLMAMARDVRVILIKLADRLHNMRTLSALRLDKRRRVARETMDIYAPIANRLGFNHLYRELQELAFSYLLPHRYNVLVKALRASRGNRREVVGKIESAIAQSLKAHHIDALVSGREKHVYGIYRKMREKRLTFSQVFDIYGFRVIVADTPACYWALGVLHGLYKPLPGKFKDYIAIPKANRYQSLHTTLIGPYGTPVEIQIRTTQMDSVAESGVASHWIYKDKHALHELKETTHQWLQSLIELQYASKNSTEFLEHVKVDLFPSDVYVFTPRGKILPLPRGATPVDFAYAVHTDIGHRCVACRINEEPAPLRTELRNGDRVEIITSRQAAPNVAWLSYVRTSKARSQIRHFFKTSHAAQSAALGEHLLARALRQMGLDMRQIAAGAWDNLAHTFGARSHSEVLTDIGLGKRMADIVAQRLARESGITHRPNTPEDPALLKSCAVLIDGTEGASVELASCCRPIPGDPIVALHHKGRGLLVHIANCPHIPHARRALHWVEVDWAAQIHRHFEIALRVNVDNHPGMLAKVASAIASESSNILDVRMDGDRGDKTSALYFTLQVSHRNHLARILRALRHIDGVARISRQQKRRSMPSPKTDLQQH
jgi:guanosine-3',5'-bis(diphosphate) 3'-pyrophosphohydrolase